MRRLLLTCLLLLCVPLAVQPGQLIKKLSVAAPPTCNPPTCQNFDATETPANWTTSGSGADFNNTTAPIEGTQDALIGLTNGQARYDPSVNAADYYFAAWFYWGVAQVGNRSVMLISDSAGALLATLLLRGSDNDLRCAPVGGATNDGTLSVDESGLVKIKARLQISPGGAGTTTLTGWVWDGSAWQQHCQSTNGTSTNNIDRIYFQNNSTVDLLHVDRVQTSSSDILSP